MSYIYIVFSTGEYLSNICLVIYVSFNYGRVISLGYSFSDRKAIYNIHMYTGTVPEIEIVILHLKVKAENKNLYHIGVAELHLTASFCS